MTLGRIVPNIKDGDWASVRQALKNIAGNLGLGPGSQPSFGSLNLTNLTGSRLVASDANKLLVSVADLTAWVAGTLNQVIVTDVGNGTIILSTPQNIHTGASPTFVTIDLTGVTDGTIPYISASGFADSIITFDGSVIKIGDVSNYVQFASDGEISLVGTARVTKSLSLRAGNFSAGSTDASDVTVGNYAGKQYTIGDSSIVDFTMPKDWDSSSDLSVYIVWGIDEAYATGSGEVQWKIDWSACPSSATEDLSSPTHTGTIDFGDQDIPATAKYLTKTSAGTISNASLSDGDQIGFTVSRVALDGGSDPTAEPFIIAINVDYTSNKLGGSI